MSFITDFKTIIEADPSINSIVSPTRIKFVHLPEDLDIRQNWLAWDYRITNQINTFGCNNAYTEYSISITLTSTDSVTMNTLSDYVKTYLNNKTTTKFIDIHFISDSKVTTLSKVVNTYQNTLEFSAIYVS